MADEPDSAPNDTKASADRERRFRKATEMILSFEQMATNEITTDKNSEKQSLIVLCAYCFKDQGLRLMAQRFVHEAQPCPHCSAISSHGLTERQLRSLCHQYFVVGSMKQGEYGGAPLLAFNEAQPGSLEPVTILASDIELLQLTLRVGFFHYGPRLWMIGNIQPLEELRNEDTRQDIIEKIINLYPVVELNENTEFYRVRKEPINPVNPIEYDAPPEGYFGEGRLDFPGHPVLYASQDIEICVHECRFVASDELYVATLRAKRDLKLLDLTEVLIEDCTEFESIDHAIVMLFLAGKHSYPISRALANATKIKGYDGIIYPSYFSMLRTGSLPFETSYGLSHRRFNSNKEREKSKFIGNIALFGRPFLNNVVDVYCVNRLIVKQVAYGFSFGPAEF